MTTPDYVHMHFAQAADRTRTTPSGIFRPALVCKDGTLLSVQASEFHYSSPRATADQYHCVEVMAYNKRGYPSLGKKDTPKGVYGWVPVAKVNALVAKHGGLA